MEIAKIRCFCAESASRERRRALDHVQREQARLGKLGRLKEVDGDIVYSPNIATSAGKVSAVMRPDSPMARPE